MKIQYIGPKESWFKKKLGVFTEKFSYDLASSIKSSIKEEIVEGKYNIE